MSDLVVFVFVILDEEVVVYICFCVLMDRIKGYFFLDGKVMILKFDYFFQLVYYMELEFFKYLMDIGADDMFFCYRWFFFDLKREFLFNDVV